MALTGLFSTAPMFKMWWVFFESMAETAKEGKKALGHFLAKQAA
jgi:hypothetical protein